MLLAKKPLIGLLFTFFCLTSSVADASQVMTTGSFLFDFSKEYNSDDIGDKLFLHAVNIDGLQKFNSALGTLNSVTAVISGHYSYQLSMISTGIPNIDSDANASGLSELRFVLGIKNLDTRRTSAPSISSLFADSISCDFSNSPGFCATFLEGSKEINDTKNATASNVGVVLDDYIGNGSLEEGRLRIGLLYPETLDFSLNGLDDATVDIQIPSFSGNVTLEYEFSPVPIPASIWFFGFSLVGLLRFSRKKSEPKY